jgi:hypothetical protein
VELHTYAILFINGNGRTSHHTLTCSRCPLPNPPIPRTSLAEASHCHTDAPPAYTNHLVPLPNVLFGLTIQYTNSVQNHVQINPCATPSKYNIGSETRSLFYPTCHFFGNLLSNVLRIDSMPYFLQDLASQEWRLSFFYPTTNNDLHPSTQPVVYIVPIKVKMNVSYMHALYSKPNGKGPALQSSPSSPNY